MNGYICSTADVTAAQPYILKHIPKDFVSFSKLFWKCGLNRKSNSKIKQQLRYQVLLIFLKME